MKQNKIASHILFYAACFIVTGASASADSSVMQSRIDAQTIQKGYTFHLPSETIKLALPPSAFKSASMITLRTMDEEEANFPPSHPTLEAMSDIFIFDIAAQNVKKPLTLFLKAKNTQIETSIYFYDRTRRMWRELPTKRHSNGYLSTQTKLLYAPVAAFQKREPSLQDFLASLRSIIVATKEGEVEYAKNTDKQFPIASLSKLMTALVFLDHNPGWKTVMTIKKLDDAEPAKIDFRVGEKIFVKDLFYSMLVGSKNNAAKALARSTGISRHEFIEEMNKKAYELGMAHTTFTDPTGLDPKNLSSAFDQYILIKTALSKTEIANATTTRRYRFRTLNTKRNFTVTTTNRLLYSFDDIIGGKTGYLDEAGYNLALGVQNKQEGLFLVLFGAPDSATRFTVAEKIIESYFHNRIQKQ